MAAFAAPRCPFSRIRRGSTFGPLSGRCHSPYTAPFSDFDPGDYTWGRAGAIALSGLLPIGIGHTLYNASMRYISATKTNLVATQEITGGVILAAIVLAEIPSGATIIGAAINLAGIFLVILGGRPLRRPTRRR